MESRASRIALGTVLSGALMLIAIAVVLYLFDLTSLQRRSGISLVNHSRQIALAMFGRIKEREEQGLAFEPTPSLETLCQEGWIDETHLQLSRKVEIRHINTFDWKDPNAPWFTVRYDGVQVEMTMNCSPNMSRYAPPAWPPLRPLY